MYEIYWARKAAKQLLKLPVRDQRMIYTSVDEVENFPENSQVKKLADHDYGYRLRVGRYRVLFDADREVRIIDIQEVKKRDERTY